MSMSLNAIRVGHSYRLVNNGETTEFQVLEKFSDRNYRIKDFISLEVYELEELLRYGRGRDFSLEEIEKKK